jgi:hypothetical protein
MKILYVPEIGLWPANLKDIGDRLYFFFPKRRLPAWCAFVPMEFLPLFLPRAVTTSS